MNEENKTRIPLWIFPSVIEEVEANFKKDNCNSKSEFIEKAVKFYLGYLKEESNVNYLSKHITEMVDATVSGTEQRLARLLFKIAVELGKLSHMVAAANDVDDETLRKLQIMCVEEVKKINGVISYDSAVRYQRS